MEVGILKEPDPEFEAEKEKYYMHTILSYPDGRYVEALLLSATKDQLRVVIRGGRDASEFKLIKGHWTSEKGVRVEVGALLTDATTDLGQFPTRHATARTSAAV